MMMAGDSLKVTLATIHCSLASVPKRLSVAGIRRLIGITHKALQVDFAVPNPRIAVAGLNPHSSEEGLFGNEETELIVPAIQDARTAGVNVEGPFPPDTVFFKASRGEFDAVVCMYHDQGLIPFKLLHFKDGVNVTLGLPIVRTSVDHGTAYDIAGTGQADCSSLAAAVAMAATISTNRKHQNQSHLTVNTRS
jgi:4-hydroxythreonine-4-phosphate dehydrogenase